MSLRRLWAICRFELFTNIKRPLFWIWNSLVVLSVMVLAAGVLRIKSGADIAGGMQAHITSQFGNAFDLTLFVPMLFPLFVAVVAGMAVQRDGELRLEQLLHSTVLRPSEYVWGNFLAAIVTSFTVLAFLGGLSALFKHSMTLSSSPELVGDFSLLNYLIPSLFFAVPLIVFTAGICFLIGESSRSPILVNMVPLVILLACVFFLWTWSPSWLEWRWNRLLMLIDPTGFRWLNETWIKVDRGAEFYNSAQIVFDPAFLFSRLTLLVIGLAAVMRSQLHLARTLRGHKVGAAETQRALTAAENKKSRAQTTLTSARLADLVMKNRPPGLVAGALEIFRLEVRLLARHPAMWVLIPLVVLNCTVDAIYAVGAFDTPLLLTPGVSAVGSLVELMFTLCLLLMFYTVESLRRERSTRIAAITSATPVPTSAMIIGKALACSAVGGVTLVAVLLTCFVLLIRQGIVPLDPLPYAVVYGLLLGPTVLFWCGFVALAFAITGSRFTTYALAIAVMIASAIVLATGKMSWVWNWSLSGALRWSDIAPFELNQTPLILNRILILIVAVLLLILTTKIFPRRVFDSIRIIERIQPNALLRTTLRLSPLILVPFVLGLALHKGINRGPQGKRIERWQKHYWQRNHATWLDAATPDLVSSDIQLELEPERRWFSTRGIFELQNNTEKPMLRIAITGGPHWKNLQWRLNEISYVPEDREGLYLFTPPQPLEPGERCAIGFEFDGVFLEGFSKNGQGSHEFIVPSGVVLTGYSPSIIPVVGYVEDIGIIDDNEYDQKEFPPDFFEGVTPALFGGNSSQKIRVEITAPERYTMNSVGILTDSVIHDGKKTVTWESDYPIDTLNVVGGLWEVRRGSGTAIFYHPEHSYNIDEMLLALDGARHYYSLWFYPYPWTELKLSEFPAEADYAQGFATNITFSESMGFLVKQDPRVNAAFMVTAHEAAHQWWGGLISPGKGPGGNIISEGLAHFSTILLFDAVHGEEQRLEFCKRIEDRYNSRRLLDSERALVLTGGSRKGDTTITYDKGGWVFWMLAQQMERENNLAGIRSFVNHYALNRDHPVLQDFVNHLRPFAPDPQAYDAFVQQWFFEVVMPEYKLTEVALIQTQSEQDLWQVNCVVQNVGSGSMPVEIAVERGQRFPSTETKNALAPFASEGTTVVLGPGESKEVQLQCGFEPDRMVIDPDVKVLQRGRKHTIHNF